jgi:hypothetical protein
VKPSGLDPATMRYTRELSVGETFDVVVAGGGPAGIAAAIAAARRGARTLLVERFGFLGGNLTAGLVGPCMTSYSLDGQHQLIRGVFEEFVTVMEKTGGAIHPSKTKAGDAYSGFIVYGHDKVTPFEPEAAKAAALEMCLDSGVELLLHTSIIDAVAENGRIVGLVSSNKGGLQFQPASIFVDATADGDVAEHAGADTVYGRDSDGLAQPMTVFFRVCNVDDDAVEAYVRDHPDDFRPFASIVERARGEGRFPAPKRAVNLYKTLRPGVWRINTTRVLGRNGTDAADLTAAEVEGRRQVVELVKFFRGNLPGFEECELLDTASTVGVRETRRVVGDYVLTLDDLRSGRHFDDVIALCGYPMDIHDPAGSGGSMENSTGTANEYEIPYRCLLPRALDNLLVAGRCVSATHEALAAIRVMPPSFAMGEAAGTAAALSVAGGCDPRDLRVDELQRALVSAGAYLGASASS